MAALVRHGINTNPAASAALGSSVSACPSRLLRASYGHHVLGRLRLKFDELRTDPSALETVRAEIAAISGVRSVIANRLTGSIVVEYDPHILSSSGLSQALLERGIACHASASCSGGQATAKFSLGRVLDLAADKLLERIVERAAVAVIAAVI